MTRGRKNGSTWTVGRFLLFVLLSFLAFVTTLAYQEMTKPPVNNPIRFVTGHLHRPGRKIVVCVGDNITRGQLSFNYIDYLAQKSNLQDFQFVNAGINGDLAYDLLQRLDPIISCKPKYIIILVGTNDLLGSLYPKLAEYYKWTKKIPNKLDIDWYSDNLRLIIETLKQRTSARIALISLPVLSEVIDSRINREVVRYNKVIQLIASKEEVSFLSLYDQQVQYLIKSQKIPGLKYIGNIKTEIWGIFDHLVLKKSLDEISTRNGYLLLTDGIHLNTRSGMMVAGQIEGFLKKQ